MAYWLTNEHGKAIYFAGYPSVNLNDKPNDTFYQSLHTQLAAHKINKYRLWILHGWVSLAACGNGTAQIPYFVSPQTLKANLTVWNAAYWTQLQAMVADAYAKGIYVEIAIFDRCSLKYNGTYRWQAHPWNTSNNSNGRYDFGNECDNAAEFYNTGNATLIADQKALVDKVIATVGSYSNVIIELVNEGSVESGGNAWDTYWFNYLNSHTDRILACNDDYTDFNGRTSNAVDMLNFHNSADSHDWIWGSDPAMIRAEISGLGGQTKPINYDEGPNMDYTEPAGNYKYIRRQLWASLTNCVSVEINDNQPWNEHNAAYLDGQVMDYFLAMDTVMQRARFSRAGFTPKRSSIVSVPSGVDIYEAAGEDGIGYVVYLWDDIGSITAGNLVLNLPVKYYRYHIYNASTGAELAAGDVTGSATTTIPIPAHANPDIAVVVNSHMPVRFQEGFFTSLAKDLRDYGLYYFQEEHLGYATPLWDFNQSSGEIDYNDFHARFQNGKWHTGQDWKNATLAARRLQQQAMMAYGLPVTARVEGSTYKWIYANGDVRRWPDGQLLESGGGETLLGTATCNGYALCGAAGLTVLTGITGVTGAGSLSGSGIVDNPFQGVALIGGAGSLSGTGTRQQAASASIAGAGMLFGTAQEPAIYLPFSTPSGVVFPLLNGMWGFLTVDGVLYDTINTFDLTEVTGAASLSGAGSLAAAGEIAEILIEADINGAGSLTAIGGRITGGTGSLSGAGTLTAAGDAGPTAQLSLIVVANGDIYTYLDGSFIGLDWVDCLPWEPTTGGALCAGAGSITVIGGVVYNDLEASVSGSGAITAMPEFVQVLGVASLSGAGTLAAAGNRYIIGDAYQMNGAGDLDALGKKISHDSGSVSGAGSLTGEAIVVKEAVADSLDAAGTLATSGIAASTSTVSLVGAGTLTLGTTQVNKVSLGYHTEVFISDNEVSGHVRVSTLKGDNNLHQRNTVSFTLVHKTPDTPTLYKPGEKVVIRTLYGDKVGAHTGQAADFTGNLTGVEVLTDSNGEDYLALISRADAFDEDLYDDWTAIYLANPPEEEQPVPDWSIESTGVVKGVGVSGEDYLRYDGYQIPSGRFTVRVNVTKDISYTGVRICGQQIYRLGGTWDGDFISYTDRPFNSDWRFEIYPNGSIEFYAGDLLVTDNITRNGDDFEMAILKVNQTNRWCNFSITANEGSYIWDTLDLTPVGLSRESQVTWNARSNGQTLQVYSSLDDGASWQLCTNYDDIPGLPEDCEDVNLLLKATFDTDNAPDSPHLYRMSAIVYTQGYAGGESTIFAGTIDTVERDTPLPGGIPLYQSISCIDYSAYTDRFYVAEIYEDMAAGDIMADIVLKYLADDGVTAGSLIDGPTITRAMFDYTTVNAAFNELANITGYLWWIDNKKRLHFIDRAATVAPWAIVAGGGGYSNPKINLTREQYRNQQGIKAGKDRTNPGQGASFTGDGYNRTFTVKFPIADAPAILVNGLPQTVGLQEENLQWIWAQDSNTITQNDKGKDAAGAEIEIPALTSSDVITITYTGFFNIAFRHTDTDAVKDRQAVEGGSGIYENYVTETGIDSLDVAIQHVQGLLNRYGVIPETVTFDTRRSGLAPGQLIDITIPGLAIGGTYLITQVNYGDDSGLFMRYSVTALSGLYIGGWVEFFKNWAKAANGYFVGQQDSKLTKLATGGPDQYDLDETFGLASRLPWGRVACDKHYLDDFITEEERTDLSGTGPVVLDFSSGTTDNTFTEDTATEFALGTLYGTLAQGTGLTLSGYGPDTCDSLSGWTVIAGTPVANGGVISIPPESGIRRDIQHSGHFEMAFDWGYHLPYPGTAVHNGMVYFGDDLVIWRNIGTITDDEGVKYSKFSIGTWTMHYNPRWLEKKEYGYIMMPHNEVWYEDVFKCHILAEGDWVTISFNGTSAGQFPAVYADGLISFSGPMTVDNIWVSYSDTGYRESPEMDISTTDACVSFIDWEAAVPLQCDLYIQTNLSLDGGATWAGWSDVVRGGAIPGIAGADLTNARLKTKVWMTTTNNRLTPTLSSLVCSVHSPYCLTGNRVIEFACPLPANPAYFSNIEWQGTTPNDTRLEIYTRVSVDGGLTWSAWTPAVNGGVITGLTTNLTNGIIQVKQVLNTENTARTPGISYQRLDLVANVNAEVSMCEISYHGAKLSGVGGLIATGEAIYA